MKKSNFLVLLFFLSISVYATKVSQDDLLDILCNCNPRSADIMDKDYNRKFKKFGRSLIPMVLDLYIKSEEQHISLNRYVIQNYCPAYDTSYKSFPRVAEAFFDIGTRAEFLILLQGEKSVSYILKILSDGKEHGEIFLEMLDLTVTKKYKKDTQKIT